MQLPKMRITVLGCGTSTGVPLIQCKCKVCRSRNPKNKRLRASLWIEVAGKSLVIDVGPDFRQQALRANIPRIDAIVSTHPHYDHIGGIDEIRSFNFIQREEIPAYGHDWTCRDLPERVPYLFQKKDRLEGGGVANISLHEFGLHDPYFEAAGIRIIPIELDHGSQKVAGLRIGNFAYLTDCHHISDESLKKLQGLDVVILDCLRLSKHDTHMNFETSLVYSTKINAKKTIFTHLSHDFEFDSFSRKLPKRHILAYDGLIISVR